MRNTICWFFVDKTNVMVSTELLVALSRREPLFEMLLRCIPNLNLCNKGWVDGTCSYYLLIHNINTMCISYSANFNIRLSSFIETGRIKKIFLKKEALSKGI